jgi:hypothetical protein
MCPYCLRVRLFVFLRPLLTDQIKRSHQGPAFKSEISDEQRKRTKKNEYSQTSRLEKLEEGRVELFYPPSAEEGRSWRPIFLTPLPALICLVRSRGSRWRTGGASATPLPWKNISFYCAVAIWTTRNEFPAISNCIWLDPLLNSHILDKALNQILHFTFIFF